MTKHIELDEELRRVAEAEHRKAETMVPCPACEHCPGCGGTSMVTVERARQVRTGEIDS